MVTVGTCNSGGQAASVVLIFFNVQDHALASGQASPRFFHVYSGHRKLNGVLRILGEPLFAAAVDDFSGQLPLALCCHVAADTARPRSRSS